jgi:hypothetical protein
LKSLSTPLLNESNIDFPKNPVPPIINKLGKFLTIYFIP